MKSLLSQRSRHSDEECAQGVIYHALKKPGNELDGATWLTYSLSIWGDIKKSDEDKTCEFPAKFPVALARKLIQCFMGSEQTVVIDPFVGSGSTCVAALREGKASVGIEINSVYADMSAKRCSAVYEELGGKQSTSDVSVVYGEATKFLTGAPENCFDFCVTSPPYWDVLSRVRSADRKDTRDYERQESVEGDLSCVSDYDGFKNALSGVMCGLYRVLKPKSYCVFVVSDIRKKSKCYPLHMDVVGLMRDAGFEYDDLIIWDRRQEYNNLKPLGYPYVFRINKVHEFILIFRVPESK